MLFIEIIGKPCGKCGIGTYQETSIADTVNGSVHCTECNDEQPCVVEESEPEDRFTLNEDSDILLTEYFD